LLHEVGNYPNSAGGGGIYLPVVEFIHGPVQPR